MRENITKLYAVWLCLLLGTSLLRAQSFPGDLELMFNYPVAEESTFVKTGSGSLISARVVQLVDSARTSIDIAAYNFDHAPLASALRRAFARGVQVRVVTDIDTQHPSLLSPNPEYFWLPVNVEGLMHHKFLVVDAEDAARATVLTGSCNFTDANLFRYYNDVIVMRSQVLAKAYRQEFELLWGSNTAVPNARNSRSGSAKPRRSITHFSLGELEGDVYFSPNDELTDRIVSTIDATKTSIGVQLLVLTQDDIAAALTRALQRGVTVFGVVENFDDPSSDFAYLNSQGASLRSHPPSEVVHHKYGVFDATAGAAGTVITGSHNWTYSAETFHDENALVLTGSALLTSLYHRAARDRHCAFGGGAGCEQVVSGTSEVAVRQLQLRLSPNPTRGHLQVRWESGDQPSVRGYIITDALGRTISGGMVGDAHNQLDLNLVGLPAGQYALQLGTDAGWSNATSFFLTD